MVRLFAGVSVLAAVHLGVGCTRHERFSPYRAAVSGAYAHLRLGECAEAAELLRPISETAGWEARHLEARTDESTRKWELPSSVWALTATPDEGAAFAACSDGSIYLVDFTGSGTALPQASVTAPLIAQAHRGDCYAAAVDAQGSRLATAGGDAVARVWDLTVGGTPTLVCEFKGHRYGIGGLAFATDGRHAFTCSFENLGAKRPFGGIVKMWDTQTGLEVAEFLGGGRKPLVALAVSPDGQRVAAASWDFAVFEWDVNTRELINTYTVPDLGLYRAVDCLEYNGNGSRIAAGTRDGRICVWQQGEPGRPMQDVATRHRSVGGVAFAPDGTTIIATGEDGSVSVWAANQQTPLHEFLGGLRAARPVLVNGAGTAAYTAGADRVVREWDLKAGSPALRRFFVDGTSGGTVDFGPGSMVTPGPGSLGTGAPKLLIHGFSGPVMVCDAATSETLAAWDPHPGNTTNFAHFDSQGLQVITGTWGREVALWRADGELIRRIATRAGVSDARFSPDGSLVAVAMTTDTLTLHDAPNGATRHAIPLRGRGEAVAFHPSKPIVAASEGPSGAIGLFDVNSGLRVLGVEASNKGARSMEFSADGRLLYLAGGDGSATCVDSRTGRIRWKTKVDDTALVRVALHPDGSRLAVAGNAVHLLDADSGRLVLTLRDHAELLWGLDWSDDGSALAVGEQDGRVTLHRTAGRSSLRRQ